MIVDEEAYLMHYGIIRRSGRYPWGSGGNEVARSRTFLDIIKELRDKGLTDVEIALGFNTPEHKFTTTDLRALTSIARNKVKQANIGEAERLREKGYSNSAIGRKMGINESVVRSLLAPGEKDKLDVLHATANMLKQQVAEKKYIDVGTGVERHLSVPISKEKLQTAIASLKEEGYKVHYVKIPQLGTNQLTTLKVLAGPGVGYSEVYANRGSIRQISETTIDGGRSWFGIHPPLNVSPKRVDIKYADQGGAELDGVVYVRPGVPDVSLGGRQYAQVRVAVGGTHYIKGMAMYKDDLPPGVDLQVNVNKTNTGNKLDALKPLKTDKDGNVDWENPFGALIKPGGQQYVRDAKGNVKVKSAMNIVNDETNWETWSKTLSSQFLSKQHHTLAKAQLDMARERKQQELDEIMSLTNPTVKRRLLEAFAEDADSSAVHLKANALPRQSNHVILPVPTLKDNEIYAPTFHNGERVVLVRHPHAGPFEIPELVVNNRNREGRKLIGNEASAAVGINSKVAQKLSGADFDGDTVLVIPNNSGRVKTRGSLDGLKNFDPIHSYPGHAGMKPMTDRQLQMEMGLISNLITDMSIKGATDSELARAVRHSMVVIDSKKHGLNYKQSAIDNGISQLNKKYQAKPNGRSGGAATLISRAKSEIRVEERKPRPAKLGGPIDKKTGERVFVPTGNKFVNPKGKLVTRTESSTKLAEAKNAHTLSSGTPIERVYAEHSNSLKAMANKARLAAVHTPSHVYKSDAAKVYSREVASLNQKLRIAEMNRPRERNAQILANAVVRKLRDANPDMEKDELTKVKSAALAEMRVRTGAKKTRIEITDSEWAAIQAGAIHDTKLREILKNADLDVVKTLATPKVKLLMTSAKIRRAQSMLAQGFTQAEVANQLGVSLTTLKNSLK